MVMINYYTLQLHVMKRLLKNVTKEVESHHPWSQIKRERGKNHYFLYEFSVAGSKHFKLVIRHKVNLQNLKLSQW
jgi:hypothetical protein